MKRFIESEETYTTKLIGIHAVGQFNMWNEVVEIVADKKQP